MKYIRRLFPLATLVLAVSLTLASCAPQKTGSTPAPPAQTASGGGGAADVQTTPEPSPKPDGGLALPWSEALTGISYYGDPSVCAMTAEQTGAYAQLLREEINKVSTIDGQTVTEEQIDTWLQQWDPDTSLAGYSHGSDVEIHFWGLSPAEDVFAALTRALNGDVLSPTADNPLPEGLTEAYDPAAQIRRTSLDTAGAPLEVYFEVPVFQQEGEGYTAINAFFQTKQDEFFAGDFEEERVMALENNPYDEIFFDTWSVSITGQTDKLVSVCLFNDYHMGGPHPWSTAEYYTFRTDTGELVTLSEILNASPDEIEAFLLSELTLQNDAVDGEIDMNAFQAYEADDYSFAIRDGRVFVEFDRYEGVSYAFGYIEPIEMTMGLKPEWR